MISVRAFSPFPWSSPLKTPARGREIDSAVTQPAAASPTPSHHSGPSDLSASHGSLSSAPTQMKPSCPLRSRPLWSICCFLKVFGKRPSKAFTFYSSPHPKYSLGPQHGFCPHLLRVFTHVTLGSIPRLSQSLCCLVFSMAGISTREEILECCVDYCTPCIYSHA